MNSPLPWSDPKSEVDPVVRSIVRYGQGLEPDAATLRRLILATAGHSRAGRPLARRFFTGLAFGLAAAFGGAAWADYGMGWFPESTALKAPAPLPPRPTAEAAQAIVRPAEATAAPLDTDPSSARAAPLEARTGAAPFQSPRQSDSKLLQDARAIVSIRPAHTLGLLRDHELRFPGSALTEERRALRVEALARLGRREDAAAELAAFESDHPRSPYRRRLRTLVEPSGVNR